jgi:hypothetical protein
MRETSKSGLRLGPRKRAILLAVVALVLVVGLVDFVVLRGDTVARMSVDLRPATPAIVELTRVGEPHVVTIRATRRDRGETKGCSIAYRITDPEGTVIVDEHEFMKRKTRHVRFVPRLAGEYSISVSDDGGCQRDASSGAVASVRITANDRRLMPGLIP